MEQSSLLAMQRVLYFQYFKAILIGSSLTSKLAECDIDDKNQAKSLLKECFTALMTQTSETISTELNDLISRAEELSKKSYKF